MRSEHSRGAQPVHVREALGRARLGEKVAQQRGAAELIRVANQNKLRVVAAAARARRELGNQIHRLLACRTRHVQKGVLFLKKTRRLPSEESV